MNIVTDEITLFIRKCFLNFSNANGSWISHFNVERLIGNRFALMENLNAVGANYIRFVLCTMNAVLHLIDLTAYDVSTRSFKRHR